MADNRPAEPEGGKTATTPFSAFFTPRQRGIVADGLTVLAASAVVGFVGVLVWALLNVVAALRQVLAPFLVAAMLAMLFKPYYTLLNRLVRGTHVLSLALFFLSVLVPLGLVVWFFGELLVTQVIGLIDRIPDLVQRLEHLPAQARADLLRLLERFQLWNPETRTLLPVANWNAQALFNRFGGHLMRAGVGAWEVVVALLGWLVLPIYLAFFLVDEPPSAASIRRYLPFLKESTREDIVDLAVQFENILLSFFRGQVLVALIQALLFGLGFWIAGLEFGFVIGFTLGLLNIVPYLGNAVGLLLIVPMAYLDGGLWQVGGVLLVFMVVQSLDSYFITPRIMGRRTGLHPVTIIFSLLFWSVVLGGFLGLLLGIPLSAFVVVLGRLLRSKYIRELV